MTTPVAAGPSTAGRLFLGRVVPLLYVLALVLAAMLARAGVSHPAAADAQVIKPAASRVKPLASRAHRHAHPVTRPRHHAAPHRDRRPVPAPFVPAPVSVVSVVSRSADRVPAAPPAKVGLVITIATVSSPATMQSAINDCLGPVEIVWGYYPTEIAEHDFCGGAAFSSLSDGERVRLIGGGLSGVYVVNGQRRFAAVGSPADQLSGMGDVVLQTCVTDGVILVGLDRVG